MLLVNVGCGASPTPGWVNLDNSLTVAVARFVPPRMLGARAGFATIVRQHRVLWASAGRIPIATGGARAVYSSHMLEHLPRSKVAPFLQEAMRVLAPAGVIRLVLPDLRKLVARYQETGDADAFVEGTLLASGGRRHRWMYDARSTIRVVEGAGFVDAREVPFGTTRIVDPGALDLRERADESFCIEAVRP